MVTTALVNHEGMDVTADAYHRVSHFSEDFAETLFNIASGRVKKRGGNLVTLANVVAASRDLAMGLKDFKSTPQGVELGVTLDGMIDLLNQIAHSDAE